MNTITPAQLLGALNWRYATKKFDVSKKIPAETWAALEESLVLTPSSMGLQPWKFIIVTDPAVKARLRAASYYNTQPEEASHLVVFTLHKDINNAYAQKYMDRIVDVRGVPPESLTGYRQMIEGQIDQANKAGRLDDNQTHQVYIALGQFMMAAALLGVDTCALGGIERAKYDDILGLTGTKFTTVVACAAGYRSADDKYATAKKVRFDRKAVLTHV